LAHVDAGNAKWSLLQLEATALFWQTAAAVTAAFTAVSAPLIDATPAPVTNQQTPLALLLAAPDF
jgi:hypothetical protein